MRSRVRVQGWVAVAVATVVAVAGMAAGPAGAAPPVGTIDRWASDVQEPQGVVVADDGTIWWTNGRNDTVGRVAPTGEVTTFEGPGIDAPGDITIGPDGLPWFANTGGTAPGISRIDASGTASGVAAVAAPRQIVTGDDGTVWAIDSAGTIVRVDAVGAVTTAYDPADTQASDVAVAPDGTVWFTTLDFYGGIPFGWHGSSVGWIEPDGDVEVLADDRFEPGGDYDGTTTIAVGPDGTVWFGAEHTLATVTPGGDITPVATAVGISHLVVDDEGVAWAVVAGHTVLRVAGGVATSDLVTQDITDITATAGGEALVVGGLVVQGIYRVAADLSARRLPTQEVRPRTMVRGPDGNLWFGNIGSIGRLTPSGELTTFPAEAAVVAVGGDDRIWFAGSDRFGAIGVDGVITEYPLPPGPVWSMVAAPGSGVWVARGESSLLLVEPDGATSTLAIPGGMQTVSLASGHDGSVWFLSGSGTGPPTVVGRIAPDRTVTAFPTTRRDSNLIVGPDGNAWFNATDGIARITPTGTITVFPVPGGSSTILASGVDGAVWFAQPLTGRVGKVTTTGVVTTFTGVVGPGALSAGPDGAMWIARRDGQVSRITPAGEVTTFPGEVDGNTIVPTGDGGLWIGGGGGYDISRIQASSDDVVSVVARFSAGRCLVLQRVADTHSLPTPAQIGELGVELLAQLAEAGMATPRPPVERGGPCAITMSWPASALERLEQTAGAWGTSVDGLAHDGAELVLALIWWMAVHGT